MGRAMWRSCRGGAEVPLPLFGFKRTWTKVEGVPGYPGVAWHPGHTLVAGHPSLLLSLERLTGTVKVTGELGSTARSARLLPCLFASLPERQPGNKNPVPIELARFKHKKPRGCRMLLAATRGAFSSMSEQSLLLLRPFWLRWHDVQLLPLP